MLQRAKVFGRAAAALGHRGKIIVNTESEPALLTLREAVMKKLKITSIPEAPPPGVSPSNGSIENGIRNVQW